MQHSLDFLELVCIEVVLGVQLVYCLALVARARSANARVKIGFSFLDDVSQVGAGLLIFIIFLFAALLWLRHIMFREFNRFLARSHFSHHRGPLLAR